MKKSGFPRLDILPDAQRALVPRLRPAMGLGFVLYGGTAIALHLGHRRSIDFDFFSDSPLNVRRIVDTLSILSDATVLQSDRNTYTALVPSVGGTVKLSFFGGISFGRVGETKDYIDVAAMITHGISLEAGLGTAELFFGKTFSPADCLRALEYFEDPQLRSLDEETRTILHGAVRRVLVNGRVGKPRRVSTSLVPERLT